MAPTFYPLPKTVDTRVHQYLNVSRDMNGSFSPHALRIAQHGKLDVYSDAVYDFSDPRFPGKGCFAMSVGQPVTIDGIDYHDMNQYMNVVACEDPKEAADLFFARNIQDPEERARVFNAQRKINDSYTGARRELLQTAVRAKLSQHLDTTAELLATGNQYMAFTDQNEYYGTGYLGKGKNMLGEAYMDERTRILRAILQNKSVMPIKDPTPEQITELAREFQNQHPDAITAKVKEITRKDMGAVMDIAYGAGPKTIVTPKSFYNKSIVGAIRSDSRYKGHKCHDSFSYLRPHQTSTNYHDELNDKYQEIYNKMEANDIRMVHSMRDYRSTNPFFGPVDFLFRGVGPIPGPAPLAVLSAVACFALIATGVGGAAVVGVAICFSAVSGAVQAYKSATENGLEGNKKIAAVLLGAAAGALAPWPGLGPIMSALYVKGVEKGLKLGKKSIDAHFPRGKDIDSHKKDTQKEHGVEVLQERQQGVKVAAATTKAESMVELPCKKRRIEEEVAEAVRDVPRGVRESAQGLEKVGVAKPSATPKRQSSKPDHRVYKPGGRGG